MIWQDVTHPGTHVEWDLVNWDALYAPLMIQDRCNCLHFVALRLIQTMDQDIQKIMGFNCLISDIVDLDMFMVD